MTEITKNIYLTDPEVTHLVNLLIENQRDGSYYLRKDQYYERTKRLLAKLGYRVSED
jgi:hypothetical protein